MIVLGVFGYYATRPINRRVETVVDFEGLAARVTVPLVLVPLVALLFHAGFQLFAQVRDAVGGFTEFLSGGGRLGVLSTGDDG